MSHLAELEEAKENRNVAKLKEENENTKHELSVIAKQLISSVQIGYGLALVCFKKEAKKIDLREYYWWMLKKH